MPTAGGAPSWSTVENLVGQRSRAFEYLKRVQQGDTHWLSTVALGPQEGPLHKGVDSTTVLRWSFWPLTLPARVRAMVRSPSPDLDPNPGPNPAPNQLRFYLGLSIGPLLQLQSGPPFVKVHPDPDLDPDPDPNPDPTPSS